MSKTFSKDGITIAYSETPQAHDDRRKPITAASDPRRDGYFEPQHGYDDNREHHGGDHNDQGHHYGRDADRGHGHHQHGHDEHPGPGHHYGHDDDDCGGTGGNTAPVAQDGSASGDEDTLIAAQVVATDVDSPTLTYALVGGAVDGNGDPVAGLSFNPDGSYSFQGPQDFNGTVSFTYKANDGSLDSNVATVVITVNPVNDDPVAAADSNTGAAIVEAGVVVGGNIPFDGNDSASGNVLANDTDVDDGDQANLAVSEVNGSAANVGVAVAGTYGALTLNADGSWTYALDNGDTDTDALAQDESAPEVFNYTVADGNGGFDTTTLTIDITGTNDQPVISGGDSSGAVTEDTVSEATGQLDVVDPDHGAQQFWTVVGGTPAEAADYHFLADSFSVTKANGTVTVLQDDFSDGIPPATSPDSGTGEYAGTVGNFGEAGDKLLLESNDGIVLVGPGAPYPFIGQTAVVKSNVDANTTGPGLKVGTQFAIAAVFDLIVPDSPREAYGIRAIDRLLNPVVNADNTITPAQVGDDSYELVVRETPTGQDVVSLRHLDFAADLTTNLQNLPLNTSLGATQIRLILNHAPNSADLHASIEYLDSLGTVIGSQNFGAVAPVFAADSVDTQTWIRAAIAAYAPQFTDSILDGSYGTLNIGQSGTWDYVLNNALDSTQSLSAGQHDSDNFTVQVADEYGAFDSTPIAIDVTGSNDAPVFQPPFPVSPVLTEDSAVTLATSGIINFTDVDLADTHAVSLTLDSANYSGGPLPAGLQTLLDNAFTTNLFDLATGDGHGQYQWNFNLDDSAVQFLGDGESLTLDYQTTVTDSSPFDPLSHASATQDITITINGVDDDPVITSGPQSGNVSEGDDGASMTASGQVTFSDVDLSDGHTFSVSSAAAYGTAGVDGAGNWSYTVSDAGAVDALAVGEHLADSFTVQVDDGHGGLASQVVSIDIVGTNDDPVITSGPQSGNVSEGDDGAGMTASGQVTFSDVDLSDGHTFSVSSAAAYGTAGVDGAGSWSYTVSDAGAVDALAVGEHLADSFTVQVDDGHGGLASQVVSIDIVGTNDDPVITSGPQSGNVSEGDDGASMAASGQVTFSDVDLSDGHTFSVSSAAAYGTAGVDGAGSWSYTVSDAGAVDALAVGEHLADSFTVQVDDGHGGLASQVVSIDIVGTNDDPVITSGPQSGNVSEGDDGSGMTASGQVTFSDVDLSDGHTFSVSSAAAYGTAGVDGAGSWSYTVSDAGAVDALAVGEHLADGFTVQVDDGHGGLASQVVSIDIVGTNDDPVITSGPQSGNVSEGDDGAGMAASGQVTFSDVDLSDGHTFSVSSAAAYGTAGVDGAGNWSYTVSDAGAVDALAVGEHLADSFTVQVDDGHGGLASQVVSIDIVGTNDDPVITSGPQSGNVSEGDDGASMAASGQVTFSDVDLSDGHTFSVSSAAAYGTAGVDGAGSWSYTVSDAGAVDALAVGEHLADSFTVQVDDGHGGLASQVVSIDIVGTNDDPVAVADSNTGPAVVEAGVVVGGNIPFDGNDSASGNVLTNDTDVDDGDQANLAVSEVNGSAGNVGMAIAGMYGALTLNADGSWTYGLDNGDPDTNALARGESVSDVFSYTVADGNGGFATTNLTIDVTGTNDQPVITGGDTTGDAEEDGATPATGQFTAVDPDHGALLSWSVDGGTPVPANFSFKLDSLRIAKNGNSSFFFDDFNDNSPPPDGPNGYPSYNLGSGVAIPEMDGRAILAADGGILGVAPGTPDPFITTSAVVRTNIDPSDLAAGLKIDDNFKVEGVFDLTIPDDSREAFGIRLRDRLVGGTGNPPDQLGDDVIELMVVRGEDGLVHVQLREKDFVANEVNLIQGMLLSPPAGADQILLRLGHNASNPGTIHASFDYLDSSGTIIGTSSALFAGRADLRDRNARQHRRRRELDAGGSYRLVARGHRLDEVGHLRHAGDRSERRLVLRARQLAIGNAGAGRGAD